VKTDPVFYVEAAKRKPNICKAIPYHILHPIGMDILKRGFPPFLAKVIFECGVSKEHANAAFELGKYFMQFEKNYENAKLNFHKALNMGEHKAIPYLKKINELMNILTTEQITLMEECSSQTDYHFDKLLYNSTNRSVYRVRRKKDNETFALKMIEIDILDFNESLAEIVLLLELKNDFVCEVTDFFIEEKEDFYYFCIVMPMYSKDLFQFMKETKFDEEVFLITFKKDYS
jgi:hypothetical protein